MNHGDENDNLEDPRRKNPDEAFLLLTLATSHMIITSEVK